MELIYVVLQILLWGHIQSPFDIPHAPHHAIRTKKYIQMDTFT